MCIKETSASSSTTQHICRHIWRRKLPRAVRLVLDQSPGREPDSDIWDHFSLSEGFIEYFAPIFYICLFLYQLKIEDAVWFFTQKYSMLSQGSEMQQSVLQVLFSSFTFYLWDILSLWFYDCFQQICVLNVGETWKDKTRSLHCYCCWWSEFEREIRVKSFSDAWTSMSMKYCLCTSCLLEDKCDQYRQMNRRINPFNPVGPSW